MSATPQANYSTMITRDQIDSLNPTQKLEVMYLLWESFVSAPETLPISDPEKQELRKRSLAHRSDPASTLSEEHFNQRLNQRLPRPK